MLYKNLTDVAQATIELTQEMIIPVLGVCLFVSILFFIIQLVFSFQDLNFQFLARFILLILVCAFMAKSASEKFVSYTKSLYESIPSMVR